MNTTDTIPPADDAAASGYSRSSSPYPHGNGIDAPIIDSQVPPVEMFPNDADQVASSTDEAQPTESIMDRLATNRNDESEPDESLNEMVQSILNDSDNDVILSNMNMMGYNNIPAQWTENENTATNLSQQPQPPSFPHSKPQV